MSLKAYLKWLTGRLFKMLPMSDTDDAVVDSHLREYIGSMSIQIDGSLKTFPELCTDMDYLMIVNTLHYWLDADFDAVVFKREIRNALALLNKMEERLVIEDE